MPSTYEKKTDRPRAYPKATIDAVVEYARGTSIHAAARRTGLSTFTIRRHLIAQGYKPNPRGCNYIADAKKLTPETYAEIDLRLKQGQSVGRVVREVGHSMTAVKRRRDALGIEPWPSKHPAANYVHPLAKKAAKLKPIKPSTGTARALGLATG